MKVLPDQFYLMPEKASTVMSKSDLKELLLSRSGSIMTCGQLWDIKSKNIGVDIYRVTLELQYKLKPKNGSQKKLQHYYDSTIGLWCIDKDPKTVDINWIRENAFQLKA